ncbi:MAG: hypothetical protein K8S87_12425 [Planctomycetes bacterium]|nr:hypothetical protein [Planctomycetota bacterium]
MNEVIIESIKRLENWIDNNGYYGWDKGDVWGTKLYKFVLSRESLFCKFIYKNIRNIEALAPKLTRRILRVKKTLNSKGIGLFLHSYAQLYELTENTNYLTKAQECKTLLLIDSVKGNSGHCWGYPNDWQSKIYFPKYTPSGIATTTVGYGLLELYNVTHDDEILDMCKSICMFIINDLNRSYHGEYFCFSYTPLDQFEVHNVNLFCAEFLSRIGKIIDNKEFIEIANKAAMFSVEDQNENGSLFYWSKNVMLSGSNDIYHSGYEMRSLYGLWKNTGRNMYKLACEKYLDYYLNNYFTDNGIPTMKADNSSVIDIHGCAEAIICLSLLSEIKPELLTIAENIVYWTINNMQNKHGWFIHRIYKKGFIKIKTKIAYTRWGQAWMIKAMVELLCQSKSRLYNDQKQD